MTDGSFVWFNAVSGSEQIVAYDASASAGNRTTVIRSAAEIDAAISGAAGEQIDVTACDGAVADGDDLYYSVRGNVPSSGNNVNFVYKIGSFGTSSSVLAEFDGGQGFVVDGTDLYVLSYAFYDDSGSFEDGIYRLSTTGTGQTPSPVLTNADLSLVDIAMASDGTIYATSNGFAGGGFDNKILEFDLVGGSTSVLADPYAAGTPFTDADIGSLEIESIGGADRIYFYNNSFNGPNGEEVGLYQIDGSDPKIVATQADIAADADVTATDIGSDTPGRLYLDPGTGDLFFANNADNFGDTDSIIQFTGVPLPVELARFDAQFTGSSIALTWKTLSETNNAGFEIQHKAPNASSFSGIGFVEGNGTTNQASDYRFVLNSAQQGTHTFRLMQVDVDGEETLHAPITVQVMGDPVSLTGPNPAKSGDRVDVFVQVESTQQVDVAVYNLLGQKVATVYNGPVSSGNTLNKSLDLSSLTSGVYFVRVIGETVSATERLSVVR